MAVPGGKVAVVTDTTAALSPTDAARWHLTVLPLHVQVGGVLGVDGDEILSGVRRPDTALVTPRQIAAAMRAGTAVTTSQIGPDAFAEQYHRLLADGAGSVVSVHLSSGLSGTVDSARAAAVAVDPERIVVVDSRSVAMGIGFAALAAARTAWDGATLPEVAAAAGRAADEVTAWFCVDSLEWLHRGGRIGGASALLGSALSVKPLLGVADGAIVGVDKVRTFSRALARLVELACRPLAGARVDVAVHHLDCRDRADEVADRVRAALPTASSVTVSEIGAVIGAHAGPGVVGIVTGPNR